MEKTKSGCVLLKEKEYQELISIKEEHKPNEIKLTWDFWKYCVKIEVSGKITLSETIQKQILRLYKTQRELVDNYIIENENTCKRYAKDEERERLIKLLENLPWYKRLFFKREYFDK